LLHVEWDSELVGRREDSNAVGRATIDAGDDDYNRDAFRMTDEAS